MQPSHCRRIVLAAVVALCVTPAAAQYGPHHGPGPFGEGGEPLHRMLDRLNLSEDQRAQIDAIVSERREAMRAKLDQMRERHLALMEAVHGEPFDEAAIRDAAAAAAVTQADLAVERAMTLAEVRGVLTPEQREQAQQMFEQRQERARSGDRGFYREHRHRGHGPGDEAARELED